MACWWMFKLLWVSVHVIRGPSSTKEKDLIEIAGVRCITLLELQECNKYLYALIWTTDSIAIIRSLSSMIGPQECVGCPESEYVDTDDPFDGCAICTGKEQQWSLLPPYFQYYLGRLT